MAISVPSLDVIRSAYQRHQYQTARRLSLERVTVDVNDGRGWELLGLINYAERYFFRAVAAFERASLLVPLAQESWICQAHAYAKLGKVKLSRDLLMFALDDDTLPACLLLQVAVGLNDVGHPELAMKACRMAAHRDPTLAQPYYDLGFYYAQCGYPAQMTEYLARKAIHLDPENSCYRVGLAALLIRQGRSKEAFRYVRDFTREQIQQVACGCCLERISDLYEAAGDLQRLLYCRQHLLDLEKTGLISDCE